ncbi:MAG TPA: GatB/YqeY domain-containing protein [Bacteroidota bacterium]|nr:GatB/YqeY domain-containing protein [Bacteroidota bacterium]
MDLRQRISEDLKSAMKSGDKIRLETLRTIRAVLLEKEIEKRGPGPGMTPEDEVGVLMSAAKKRKESIELFRQGGRLDLAEQEEKELAIIQEYLPKQMTEEEIAVVIREAISQTGASAPGDFGKVMPLVMKQVKGKADGRIVQDLVKKSLGIS